MKLTSKLTWKLTSKGLLALAMLLASGIPVAAQRRVELLFDAEGVHRSNEVRQFTPNSVRFVPHFSNGGGIGGGVRWFLSDRVAVEAKVAALETRARVVVTGSDFVAAANIGNAQIYPIMAVLQWHPVEHGTFRPYVGAGAAHIVLKNINRAFAGGTGIRFSDPTGFVVDGGLDVHLSKRFALTGDVRYIPIETTSRATLLGTNMSTTDVRVRPLVVSGGVAWRW